MLLKILKLVLMNDGYRIPQAKNISYQPLLIKPIFSVLAYTEKQFFKTSLPVFDKINLIKSFLMHVTNLVILNIVIFIV